jgi:Protein of unknown function (DUF559)
VLALVELDDSTHNAHADQQRDAITKAAGYQTIRFQSKNKPSQAEIAALFCHAQAWAVQEKPGPVVAARGCTKNTSISHSRKG